MLWHPPRALFSVRMSNKHCFCRADRLLAASWRVHGCPGWPLAAPGGPWRPLAAAWVPLAAPGGPWRLPGCPWRLPGCPWRPLATSGGSRFFLVSSFWQVSKSWPFLEEFIFQIAPKLVLVTVAPFGPSGGQVVASMPCIFCIFAADL